MLATLLLSFLALPSTIGGGAAPADGKTIDVAALSLKLVFPPQFSDWSETPGERDKDELGDWRAKLGAKTVFVSLEEWDKLAGGEPADITWRIHDFVRDEDYEGPPFQFAEHKLVPGPYGYAPYGSLLWGSTLERGTTKDVSTLWYFAGVTDKTAYLLSVEVQPVASAEEKQLVLDMLAKGVVYSGPVREQKWKEEEVEARWKNDSGFTDKRDLNDLKIIRSEHYLVMTNSGGGDKFAKQMEINYGIIQKTYPFPEVPGRKLMPVFLFRNPEEYHAFCVKVLEWTPEEARKSKGVAYRDFYATWYEAPGDPVHIHEATHQIFSNRLELGGGGSWFQEGVAEYIETKPNERNDIARRVKKGEHTPLKQLMQLRSLLMSSENDNSGDSAASLHYAEAALLIEFLRESKFGKAKFLEWLHAMGNAPRRDLAKIEAIFQRIYGVDIDGLDAELQKYCQKR